MPQLEKSTVGPPDPVADSRQLPVITPDDEGGFVTGTGRVPDDHPDNDQAVPDNVLDEVLVAASPEDQAAAEAAAGDSNAPDATDAELDQLTAEVESDDLDMSGFGVEELGFVGFDALDDPRPDQGGGA